MATIPKEKVTTWDGNIEQSYLPENISDLNNDQTDEEVDPDTSLETILEDREYLYDLHTHLLGMGNSGFWVDSIIDNRKILPEHADFCSKLELRKKLCPLIWNKKKMTTKKNPGGFINGDLTAAFFQSLIAENFPESDNISTLLRCIPQRLVPEPDDNEDLLVFRELMNDGFIRKLKHYHLFFGKSIQGAAMQTNDNPEKQKETGDFTYDVVLTLDDLGKGLGVTTSWMSGLDDLIQSKIEEKLGLHTYQGPTKSRPFRLWIVFNAREQKFQVVKGITVETLRELITVKANAPSQACTLARAHLQNAFSMCNPDGTDPRPIDFDRFHGSFTPEFYPRHFSLKDSIYSQRLDVLASLLVHILRKYQCCLPPIRYCELSVGVGDLCRPWVFDVLRSFHAYDPITKDDSFTPSDFCTMIVKEDRFPHLRSACLFKGRKLPCIPNVTYKFLAGFNRQSVRAHRLSNQTDAIRLLNDSPDVAIHYMLLEIVHSEKEEMLEEPPKASPENNQAFDQETHENLFDESLEDLKKLKIATEEINYFKSWVVGLDLFGDEMGYPYCPFVTWPFRRYIRDRRSENKYFGLRIHYGENVPFADNDAGAYRHFVAHMYIAFRCLRFLQRKMKYGIRVGHGIAFARILSENMSPSRHRKSSVLLAEMREHAIHVLKNIVFEINITSNEYLLGHALREGDYHQIIRLSALTKIGIPIILSTDDDGIWPIDHCPSRHPGHHSLVAEYCRAFSLSLITSPKQLETMLDNTNNFCFYSRDGVYVPPEHNNENWIWTNEDRNASTIVFHPDLIKVVLQKYYLYDRQDQRESQWGNFYQHYRLLYPKLDAFKLSNPDPSWFERCSAFAPIAYVAHNTNEDETTCDAIETEFDLIFPNNKNRRRIYEAWIKVRKNFMFPNNMTDSKYIETDSGVVFFSESSHNEKQQLLSTLQFVKDYNGNCRRLQVFSRQTLELDTSEDFNSVLRSLPPETGISTAVYTTNKNEYIDSTTHKKTKLTLNEKSANRKNKDEDIEIVNRKKVKFTFDEKPTNRTNCSNVKEQHMLYVICRHASAATAYLHYVGNSLVERYPQLGAASETSSELVTEDDPAGIQAF